MSDLARQLFWLMTCRMTYSIVISLLLMSLKRIFGPILWLSSSLDKRQKLKPIVDPLLTVSAVDLTKKIRRREVSSEQVVRAYIKRIREVNPILNAVVDERYSSALREAKDVDEFLAQTDLSEEEIRNRRPLLGLPFTVKESCKLAGMSFAVGCKTRLGFVAEEDGEAVARLRRAGAIPLLVSSTPEMCFGLECDTYITGTTRNPYDASRTCGGSSGGEGALIGSAASLVGIGSDIGGSIRIPCLFNGIFGHKPSTGVVPSLGHYPRCNDKDFISFISCGPMARYAEDLKLLMKVMASEELNLDEEVAMQNVTVHHMEDVGSVFYMIPVEEEIKIALRGCVEHLGKTCSVSDVKFPKLADSFEMSASYYFNVQDKPDVLVNQNNPKERYSLLTELIKFPFARSTLGYNSLAYYALNKWNRLFSTSKDQYVKKQCEDLKQKMISELGDYGVLLYPTIHCLAFPHKQTIFNLIGIAYCTMFNVLGFPSTHVPLGLGKKGLPVGIQVIAGPNRDVVCLAVAQELEKAFGGWVAPT